jgi:hypothetical protein
MRTIFPYLRCISRRTCSKSPVDVIDLPEVCERGREGAWEASKGVPKTIVYRVEHRIPYASDKKHQGNRAVAEITKERHCCFDLSYKSEFFTQADP